MKNMRQRCDEGLVLVGEGGAHRHLFEAVGERAGFAHVLQAAHAVVVSHGVHEFSSVTGG